ncbi:MAG: acetyl-CoA carboxylase biotin carboxylase subunit [Syntrophomonadaceae bacterium]|mgnify:CR=1 FL=1|nr:acetyl-CoA carboxylase biotin carboxylase subunit [Syntrophomonadaceae bacterium]
MISKILVANRGEIAVRIIRACKELGITTVAVYSKADASSLHVRMADQAVCIGEAPAGQSYLNISNIISAAINTGCQAIHPGYGFLAENAYFAEMCSTHGVKFIGPSPHTIKTMGDKIAARELAGRTGIPVVPGSQGGVSDVKTALRVADEIEYPVLLKAAAGGGGKGMRLVHNRKELERTLEVVQYEAQAAFGDGKVYIEKYIEEPRHIEIQVLGDEHGNLIHLGERDCSIQRRNQKLLEESPSPFVDEELRARMGQMALKVAEATEYCSAGTVEFLVDRHKNCYFIEVNTRIQVEHPVTEMVTGVDLIKEQIKIAGGSELKIPQDEVKLSGWAIECRINAEDPNQDFIPSAGTVVNYLPAGGPGVRVDSYLYTGYTVLPYYDSLLGKLIVWAPDRSQAIERMDRALGEHLIEGVKTTIPFHQQVLGNSFFRRGEVYTNFIARRIDTNRK